MTAVGAMVVLGAVCLAFRVLFIVVVPADRLPAAFRSALSHLAPAILAALVAVGIESATESADAGNAGMVLGVMGLVALAVWRTGSLLLGVAISLAGALVLDLVVGG